MSIAGVLNIGRSALQVNQAALQVTSNNIANVNTPGYSRQRIAIETTTPFRTDAGFLGTGVNVQEISRVYDRFLAFQVKSERENYGALSSEKDTIFQVEDILNEIQGPGLKEELSAFFNSLGDLSNNADGYVERSQVLSNANSLVYSINTKASDLSRFRTSVDNGVKSVVSDINGIASQVADLNTRIAAEEVGGVVKANVLRDKRDTLMGDLAGFINYNYTEDSLGQVSIFVGKGSPLVLGKSYNLLSTVANPGNGNMSDVQISNGTANIPMTFDISGGNLKGLLNVRDTVIPDYQNRLNTFTDALVSEVNAQHALGYGLDGSTGLPFFAATAGNEAATISVAITDTNKIAAAGNAPGPADNENVLKIMGIQDKSIVALGNTTLDNYYDAMVTDIGSRSQSVSRSFEYQEFSKQQLESRIQSVSGVSMDEEAANLIKFQRAYQAAAKLITTVDEMTQTILELKR